MYLYLCIYMYVCMYTVVSISGLKLQAYSLTCGASQQLPWYKFPVKD